MRRFRNDKELPKNGNNTMTASIIKENKLQLELKCVKLCLEDAGKMKVVAKNSEGEAKSVAKLTVLGNRTTLTLHFQHFNFNF